MSDRPLRLCDVCGGLDDHPRHVQSIAKTEPDAKPSAEFLDSLGANVPASAVALLMNPRTRIRHIDCCAAAGCKVCAKTETVTGGKRGNQLLKAIQSGALDGLDLTEG